MPSLRKVIETTPLVEGLRLTERVDDAGNGEVWRARVTGGLGGAHGGRLPGELAGVGECVVRLLRLPAEETGRARALALANDLLAVPDPGLVAVRAVRPAFDGVALVIEPPSPALPLHLLSRERQLAAGEIVTLGIAVAWALDTAHRAGLTHGRLRDSDVLLDAGGRPMLAGVGVMGVLGDPGEALDDVMALARLLASLLDTRSKGATKVLTALGKPERTAADLATQLAEATPAAPIRMAGCEPAPQEAPPSVRRFPRVPPLRRPSRLRVPQGRALSHVLAAAAGVMILLVSSLIGWAGASGPVSAAKPPPPASSSPIPRSPQWQSVLGRLDTIRAAAFADPAAALLDQVDVPGKPAYAYDVAALKALRLRGAHALGLRLVIERVSVTSVEPRRATLAVTDHRLAYDVADASGRVISRPAARGSTRHVVQLTATGVTDHLKWRIATVT